MRMSTLRLPATFLVAAACGNAVPAESYVVIEDFLARSPRLACERVELGDTLAPTLLRTVPGAGWGLLEEPLRRVTVYDEAMRPLWRADLPAQGPGAVTRPVAFALGPDSMLAVVGRDFTFVRYPRAGTPLTMKLDFIPNDVSIDDRGVTHIAALAIGDLTRALVLRVDGDSLRPLPIKPRRYADLTTNGIGNDVALEALANGDLLVFHRFFRPRAFRVSAAGAIESLSFPVPDAAVHLVDVVPPAPITEEKFRDVHVSAAGTTFDSATGILFVITRAGRATSSGSERALMRLNDRLGYLDSFMMDVRAAEMAYLPGSNAILLLDDEDGLHKCPLPPLPDAPAS